MASATSHFKRLRIFLHVVEVIGKWPATACCSNFLLQETVDRDRPTAEDTHGAQTALVVLFHSSIVQVSALCFARRHSWILLEQCYRLVYCDGSTWKGKSWCVHATHTPWFVGHRRHFSQVKSPSTNSMTRRILLMRNDQATPILLEGNLPRSMMSSSRPAISLGTVRPVLRNNENHESAGSASGSASRREPNADALYGAGRCENIILRIESQECSIRSRVSEEMARSEFGAMERDVRYALFYQDQQFKIAVGEYQRRERDAVYQAVTESSEHYEIMMMQEFQGIQNRCGGRTEEVETRVKEAICCLNIKFFTKQEKEENVREKPDELRATVTLCKLSRIFT